MKKIFGLILFLFCFCGFYSSISAATDKIASCVYKAQNVINGEAPSKLIININKDYSINFDYLGYTEKRKECGDPSSKNYESSGCNQMTFNVNYDFKYGDFIKDTKFDCNNIPKIYHNNDLDVAQMKIDYTFNKTKTSKLKGVYILDKKESTVEIENPAQSDKEEGWLKVCHYNDVTLKFNKTEYEILNAYPIKKGYPLESTDLLKYIADNNYSCPFKYCYYTANGQEDIDGNLVYSNLGYFINAEDDYTMGKTCYFSADYSGDEFTCGGILAYMNEFDEYNKNYSSTGEISYLNLRKKSEEKVKSFCRSVLVNSNYNDSNDCVKECISIDEVIANRIGEQTSEIKACGFSEKLIIYIANIVKWLKYIIPVIVIVLGILDFIKAIASEKDDDMKKAQGHFIKRLIAAALIFIIPFIIEFVLDKMGFASNGCGIIDL